VSNSYRRRLGLAVVVAALIVVAAFAAIAVRVFSRVVRGLHPERETVGAPTGLSSVEPITLKTRDQITLRGWYVPTRNGAVIVLVHGYGAQRTQLLPEARALASNGYGVLLFDLRGHGESGGDGTTWGAQEQLDMESALDFAAMRPEVDRHRIGALGFSIGAMAVAQVAARDARVRAAVLEGAFTSLEDMIRHDESRWGWWSEWIATETLRARRIDLSALRPADVVCRIAPRPILIVNGTEDEDTPLETARSLFNAACAPKDLWLIPGAHHTGYAAAAGPALGEKVVRFFDASMPRVSPAPERH
jgi:dipeptidyl aminopeptidase/acylaminoacyl peptidase